MKKFLTFFAMMFVLLGFSIPTSAVEYTVYVDVSAKGWSDCYLKTHYSDNANDGWHIPDITSKTNLGNGLYKFVFSYDGLKDVIISNNNNASNRGNEGTDNVGWFSPSKTGNWEFASGKLYTLASGTSNSATVTTYTEPVFTPPYIFIDGSSKSFDEEGNNWVYTVEAADDVEFRLQSTNSTTSLAETTSMASYTVIYGGTNPLTSSPISNETIYLYGNSGYAGNITAPKGYSYKIAIDKSKYAAAKAVEGSNSFTWSVTPVVLSTKPAAPGLPTSASGDKVTITVPSGVDAVYYSTSAGTPSTETWTRYTGAITIPEGETTIYAASLKGDEWSDVVSVKYSYTPVETNPPYIYINGACEALKSEGSNWVYTVTASDDNASFRLQMVNTTNPGQYQVFYGGSTTLNTTGAYTEKIYLYQNGWGSYTAPKGYSYKISINKEKFAAVNSGNTGLEWTVTPTPLPTVAYKVIGVEVEYLSGVTAATLTYDEETQSWSGYPLTWKRDLTDGSTQLSGPYRFKITTEAVDGSGVTAVKYATWADNTNYWLTGVTNTTTTPYTFSNASSGACLKLQQSGNYYVQAAFNTKCEATWLSISQTVQTPPRPAVVDPTPFINTEAWSLSDDKILAPGETKYFYMSALQNDNRLSPEWELVKNAQGKYVLDNFVVIPRAQFIIRGVTKSQSGQLTVTDWGYDKGLNGSPYFIYATKQDFHLENLGTLTEASRPSATFPIVSGQERGFMWNVGVSMVSLEFDPDATGNKLTATIDFSYPSTLAQAPIKGFPWVGLTASNITARVGADQKYNFSSGIGVSGLTGNSDLMNTIGMTKDGVESAFTNAFIQWTADEKVYVYDSHVNDISSNNKQIYYFNTSDNRNTTCKPNNGHVMSSTILPPRTTPQFKQYTSEGVTSPSAESLTFKYTGVEEAEFTYDNVTTRKTKFAVYELSNIELQGLFKVFTGYGGRTYGSEVNGLTFFSNWGIKVGDGYTNEPVTSTAQLPLGGGGQVMTVDSQGREIAQGSSDWGRLNIGNSGSYADDDNDAGMYFRLDDRQYVESLKFYLALEPDIDDNTGHKDHNPRNGDTKNTYNNGRNYSWLDVNLSAERPIITLNKRDASTGRARWTINRDHTESRPPIKSYKTALYKIDKDNFDYDPETGVPTGLLNDGKPVVEGFYTLEVDENGNYPTWVDPETRDISDLADGWFIARIYAVEYDNPDNTWTIKSTDTWNYSQPIYFFSAQGATLRGQQLITEKDEMNVYHPVIRVIPDLTDLINDLPSDTGIDKVWAELTVSNIGPKTRVLDLDGNPMKSKAEVAEGTTEIYYERLGDNSVKITYPMGYLTEERPNIESFDLSGTKINDLTRLSLQPHVEGAADGAPVVANPNTYMPAGKLFGTLVATAKNSGDLKFNYLSVAAPEGTSDPDYAHIYFVDRNNNDERCYISGLDDTDVVAQVWYVNDGTNMSLFDDDALLNMKGNPEDDDVYTSKRLKIGNLPYKEATDTDVDGSTIKVRQDQTAEFLVQLTYTSGGFEPWNSRQIESTLTLDAKTLTSPRQGLKDVLTEDDAAKRGEGMIATDMTAVTERYVENYGGLFTNIEDAHVALQAVDRNEDLVGYDSFDKWYMDHGNTFLDETTSNPFSPRNHLAIGQNGASAPAEVHPLLKEGSAVASPEDFENTSALNNAWWNQRAQVAPNGHVDQIKGSLKFENGTVTWTSGSAHPSAHANYWAGVKSENDATYKTVWNNGVMKVDDQDVDIRDPKHGYYGMNTHYSDRRSAFGLGEMPLNANDVLCLVGQGTGNLNGTININDKNAALFGNDSDLDALVSAALKVHEQYETALNTAINAGEETVTINGQSFNIAVSKDSPWNLDNVWETRAKLAFADESVLGATPAAKYFELAGNHMFFKVNHVNHEAWFVPGGGLQHDIKTRPIWPAFSGMEGWPANGSDTDKENFVMKNIRVDFSDYCPLAYDVRYTYPFLTSAAYVTAENYEAPASKVRATTPGSIVNALDNVKDSDVSDIVARDLGRVSFFGATEPQDYVPTVIADVNADIRGNGFSIIYNRAAGTVTISAEGDRELKEAAVYDATGASLVRGASADRVNDQTIVLDVRGIAQGAYVISTNLGGAKFMK